MMGLAMRRLFLVAGCLGFAFKARAAEPRTYVVDPAESVVTIKVGKAGLFKFAGHEHEVITKRLKGEVVADAERLDRSSVVLSFETQGLEVSEKGEPSGDAPKVQEKMRGPDVLDVVRFPDIVFRSRQVSGTEKSPWTYDLEIVGDLGLHGVTRSLALKVRVEVNGENLTATGTVSLRQSDFGLQPVSVAGVVKVKDELSVICKIVARTSLPAPEDEDAH